VSYDEYCRGSSKFESAVSAVGWDGMLDVGLRNININTGIEKNIRKINILSKILVQLK
jgi:hypothetical protein